MIHNSYRNFYDLLFIIFLTKYFEMTLIKASLLISVLILGQSLQVVSSYIYKILNSKFNFTMFFANFLINIPLMFLMSLFLYIIFTKHNIMNYYYLFLINVFFIGFARALYASFQEYYNFEFIKKDKKNFSDYEGNKVFFSEIGNLSGYLISTVLLLFYYKLIFYQILIFILLSILISLY
jgi:hypothetical protein